MFQSDCSLDWQVAILFRTHSDLLQEFTYFLPDSNNPAQVCGRKHSGCKLPAFQVTCAAPQGSPPCYPVHLEHLAVEFTP